MGPKQTTLNRKGNIVNLRKIVAVAIFSTLSVSAIAAPVDPSDGRMGGAFWNQPITKGAAVAADPVGKPVIGQADPSDGRLGGAYWGNAQATATRGTTGEQFVGTAQVKAPFSFLTDYNP